MRRVWPLMPLRSKGRHRGFNRGDLRWIEERVRPPWAGLAETMLPLAVIYAVAHLSGAMEWSWRGIAITAVTGLLAIIAVGAIIRPLEERWHARNALAELEDPVEGEAVV